VTRDRPVTIALLLTPGLARVVTIVPYLCQTFLLTHARGTIGGTGTVWEVRSTGETYVPFSFPQFLEQLRFLIEAHHRPGFKYAFFLFSYKDRVEKILRVHQRIPITVRGRRSNMERTENRPYGLSRNLLELGKPLDSVTYSAIVK
jgi:hypothetical protein